MVAMTAARPLWVKVVMKGLELSLGGELQAQSQKRCGDRKDGVLSPDLWLRHHPRSNLQAFADAFLVLEMSASSSLPRPPKPCLPCKDHI